MTALQTLVQRDGPTESLNPTVTNLLIALLSLSIVAVVAALALISVRYVRTHREARYTLPTHSPTPSTLSPPTAQRSKRGHRRTLSITTVPCAHDLLVTSLKAEKDAFLNSPTNAPPRTGVPEIHITFPDEDRDVNEKRHSGRVVVVRISDNGGIGLAPYLETGAKTEGLPPYCSSGEHGEFMSLDLTKLGGLKEKEQVFG